MRLGLLTSIAVCVVLVSSQPAARADIPPPQACTSPGQPCTNAGTSANQAGTCATTTCTRTVPAADGGTMQMMYSCMLCVASGAGGGAGTGGASGNGGASGAAGGGDGAADASTNPPRHDSGGCAVAAGSPGSSAGPAAVLALCGLAVALRRGRRRTGGRRSHRAR